MRQKLSTVSPPELNTVPSSLEQRRAFLQKSPTERSQILAQQADTLLDHYQHSTEWRELIAGDITDD